MFARSLKSMFLCCAAFFFRDVRPKVVFYHDIGTTYTPMGTPADLFFAHMQHLSQCTEKHRVCLDDGFRGIWDHREGLRRLGIKPTVFLAVSLVGQANYLTWNEIRILQNEYGFDFQCHTWSHQTLAGPVNTDLPVPATPDFRTDSWYHHELVDSKAEIEKKLSKRVSALCFPVGYFSDDVIRRCIEAGYQELYASYPGNRDEGKPTGLIPRILCQSLSQTEFKLVLAGGMNRFRRHYLRRHYCK